MSTEIQNQLHQLALKRSAPFCYSCYRKAPTGTCEICGSDDLMRETENGCEYGTDWIIESILATELTPVDLDEEFEEFVRQVYDETTTVGWMTNLDTVTVMKEMDPVAWDCAQSEWVDQESSEGTIISFDNGSTYYRHEEVEKLAAT